MSSLAYDPAQYWTVTFAYHGSAIPHVFKRSTIFLGVAVCTQLVNTVARSTLYTCAGGNKCADGDGVWAALPSRVRGNLFVVTDASAREATLDAEWNDTSLLDGPPPGVLGA